MSDGSCACHYCEEAKRPTQTPFANPWTAGWGGYAAVRVHPTNPARIVAGIYTSGPSFVWFSASARGETVHGVAGSQDAAKVAADAALSESWGVPVPSAVTSPVPVKPVPADHPLTTDPRGAESVAVLRTCKMTGYTVVDVIEAGRYVGTYYVGARQ